MNIKTIIVGSLAVGLTIGGTFFKMNSQDKQAVYSPRTINSGGVYGQAGYAEYMHMLKADPATGKIDYNLVMQAREQVIARSKKNNKAALGLNWTQMGPDNVGGRTRAVLVDRNNSNIIYAGSIGGGLFVSTDATLTWSPATGMQGVIGENLAISCITQTNDGRIFFGTGATFESPFGNGGSGFLGNGVYEYVPSTGAVLPVLVQSSALPNISTGGQLTYINAIASYGTRLYVATTDGMIWADPVSGVYPTTYGGWTNPIYVDVPNNTILENGTCQDIDVASDGTMLVCFSGKVYTSTSDVVGSFSKHTKSGSRLSGAIAPSNSNVFYVLRSSSNLQGLEISQDKGASWDLIVPGGSPCMDPFVQNDCTGGQGGYDDAIAVDPSDWGHILVGGVQLYEWQYASGSNPIGGSWLKAANLFESSGNQFYVHADKHTIVWPTSGTVYIGSDGGVAKSVDNGVTWQARNLGYNVTTFYDAGMSGNGWFAGGAQDNGTQLFTYGAFGELTPLGTTEISTGDGFDVAFSNLGTGVVYSTSQNGSLMRSAGGTPSSFYDAFLSNLVQTVNQPFHTVIENWEKVNDPLSMDSIEFLFDSLVGTVIKPGIYDNFGNVLTPGDTVYAGDTIFAGDTIKYFSLTNGIQLTHVVPSNIILNYPADTLNLVDPIQNKFAVRVNSGVYLTRDAARLNATTNKWFKIAPTTGVENIEFSPDGNHVFLGTSNGGIVRVSGLSYVNNTYSQAGWDSVLTVTALTSGLGGVVGLACDPNDGNNLIATSGSYTTGNHVYRSTNALTTGTFSPIQGSGATGLPKMPVYAVEVDYTDNNQVILGTEWGVWTTDNAFSAASGSAVVWSDENGNGMSHVPVFAVEQQHLRYNECVNSGIVYLGTHGRGFYTTDVLVSIEENNFDDFNDGDKNSFVTDLNVYPNPLNNNGVLAFELKKNANTTINIYNLTGSLVKTVKLGEKAKGEHKIKFDASSLSVGSYILSLESGSERSVAKFIVTR